MKIDRRNLFLGGAAATLASSITTRAEPDPDGYPRLMQGPRIGWTTPHSITVWVRLSDAYQVSLEYGQDPQLRDARQSAPVRAPADRDYTAVLEATGLKPGTVYYRVLIDGAPTIVDRGRTIWRTATAPARDSKDRLKIAFGSCARYAVAPQQPVWDGVARQSPDLFLWLGDNIYGDALRADALREEYRRQLMVPNLMPVQSGVSQLATWDDHDYGLNDSDRTNPIRDDALAVFREYWPNPDYGLPDAAGVFFRHSFGPVDLFMLDNRYHRSPAAKADGPGKTALGQRQRDWLFESLKDSDAVFRIVASGQGWTDAKEFGQESWASYLHERNLIVDFIRKENVKGVILLSGDTHVAELNALPGGADGYDLIECVSSPLAQETAMSWLNYKPVERLRQVYAGGPNFGLLDFDFGGEEPTVRLNACNVSGDPVWSPVELRASELQRGQSFWREKMDAVSRRRWQRFEQDGTYYG